MWTVYVLRSESNQDLYVGMTENLSVRIQTHNAGKVKSTKANRPWKLLHQEELETSLLARKREKYLKSGYGKMWLKTKFFNQ